MFSCPYSYAFGSTGKEKFQIPPNAELKYEIHLKSFEKVSSFRVFLPHLGRNSLGAADSLLFSFGVWQAKESWEMSSEEKLEQSTIVKERGTVYFKVSPQQGPQTLPGQALPRQRGFCQEVGWHLQLSPSGSGLAGQVGGGGQGS